MKIARLLLASLPVLATACPSDDPKTCDPTVAGTICTIAGSGENGYNGDQPVPAFEAQFSLPQDTLTAPDGTIYIVDWNNHRIRALTGEGEVVHVAGRGELGGTLDDPANSDFNHLTNLIFACDGSGDILISAWHNSKVRRLDLATGEIIDECGDGRRAYFGDEMEAMTSSLDLPAAIACDPDNNLVIMDQANQVIRMIDSQGIIHRIAGVCVIDRPAPSGPGPCEEPVACPAPSGKFTCGDPATTCPTPCNPSFNGDQVPALEMRMAQPFGQSADPGGRIAYAADGSLYFADASNHLIRRIDPDGIVHIVAGTAPDGAPVGGYAGDGGPATLAQLYNPVDLALADDGTLYFTDTYNHCVRAIDPGGTIDTIAGVCGDSGFDGDGGDPTQAHLNLPFGIELSGGRLLIADMGNQRIRSIVLE